MNKFVILPSQLGLFMKNCTIVTNAHVGSLGDILTYSIDVDPDLQVTKVQLLDLILHEIASDGYTEGEQSEFWDDMTNLQKAKIVR